MPAHVQETVTVVGTAPVLDVSSAHIGVNVSERDIKDLPVNGRQMSQLMLQAPGYRFRAEPRFRATQISPSISLLLGAAPAAAALDLPAVEPQ